MSFAAALLLLAIFDFFVLLLLVIFGITTLGNVFPITFSQKSCSVTLSVLCISMNTVIDGVRMYPKHISQMGGQALGDFIFTSLAQLIADRTFH